MPIIRIFFASPLQSIRHGFWSASLHQAMPLVLRTFAQFRFVVQKLAERIKSEQPSFLWVVGRRAPARDDVVLPAGNALEDRFVSIETPDIFLCWHLEELRVSEQGGQFPGVFSRKGHFPSFR